MFFVGGLFGLFCCIFFIWVVEIVTSFANVGLWVITFLIQAKWVFAHFGFWVEIGGLLVSD